MNLQKEMEPTKAPWSQSNLTVPIDDDSKGTVRSMDSYEEGKRLTRTTMHATGPASSNETDGTVADAASLLEQRGKETSSKSQLNYDAHLGGRRSHSANVSARPIQVTIPTHSQFPRVIEDIEKHTFSPAKKKIESVGMLRNFLLSETASDFVSFIVILNESVKGRKITESCELSNEVHKLIDLLDNLEAWVHEIPPVTHSVRYGNPAFRTWISKLKAEGPHLLAMVLPEKCQRSDIMSELTPYLLDSFGNETRIDYGTGHETNFVALLYCLSRLGVLCEKDSLAIVTRIFNRYLQLMRLIQTTYWLEPAGSHGAWGLDDYQFLPFLWGSAQLIDHPFLAPHVIHSDKIVEEHANDFLYIAAVRFVRQVKRGPLRDTSPMLTDISGVVSWSKINKGMRKMYEAEVLGRFPIMQHFLFGSLLSF